jgi:hypothetical protein
MKLPQPVLPDAFIPVFLRLTRANTPFTTVEGAQKEIHDLALRPRSTPRQGACVATSR